jgi:putative hydrolase of HD superfamily
MGWVTRGVPHVESIADHSFGVALLALALCDMLSEADQGVHPDREKVLVMALLHDLAEVRLTDLPASASRLIPAQLKSEAEATAIARLLAPLPTSGQLEAWWQEFEDSSTAEGKIVRDADKLEMMVQCLRYEQAGSAGLEEFWQAMDQRQWSYAICAEIYGRLREARPHGQQGAGL